VKGILLWIYPWRPNLDDDLIVNQILPTEAAGKRFKTIRQKILEPMRNTIAHGLMRSGEIKTVADRLEDIENVSKWLPLLRVWVRVLFATEFPTEFGIGKAAPAAVGEQQAPFRRRNGVASCRDPEWIGIEKRPSVDLSLFGNLVDEDCASRNFHSTSRGCTFPGF
jgi:hypothetical protein